MTAAAEPVDTSPPTIPVGTPARALADRVGRELATRPVELESTAVLLGQLGAGELPDRRVLRAAARATVQAALVGSLAARVAPVVLPPERLSPFLLDAGVFGPVLPETGALLKAVGAEVDRQRDRMSRVAAAVDGELRAAMLELFAAGPIPPRRPGATGQLLDRHVAGLHEALDRNDEVLVLIADAVERGPSPAAAVSAAGA